MGLVNYTYNLSISGHNCMFGFPFFCWMTMTHIHPYNLTIVGRLMLNLTMTTWITYLYWAPHYKLCINFAG